MAEISILIYSVCKGLNHKKKSNKEASKQNKKKEVPKTKLSSQSKILLFNSIQISSSSYHQILLTLNSYKDLSFC